GAPCPTAPESRSLDVEERRLETQLLEQNAGLVLLAKLRHVAVRIVEIAEVHRVRDAARDAHGRVRGIDAGRGARRRLVHAMLAEGALRHHAVTLGLARLLLRRRRALHEIPLVVVHHVPRAVRARDGAVAAADAHVVLHEHDAVGTLLARTRRTYRHARRLSAVLAPHGQERASHVGILTNFHVDDVSPEHAGRQRVLLVAGDGTRLAADALAEVDDHSVTHLIRGGPRRP